MRSFQVASFLSVWLNRSMTTPKRGEGVSLDPDQLLLVEAQKARRLSINRLVIDFLHERNSGVEKDAVASAFHLQKDIFSSKPLKEVIAQRDSSASLIRWNYNDALSVARFYWDNPDVTVPDRVVYITGPNAKNLPKDFDRKFLLFIEEVRIDKGAGTLPYEFKDSRFTLKGGKPQQLPDIYLKDVSGSVSTGKNWWDTEPRGQFTIAGASNVIFDSAVHLSMANYINSVDITCVDKCVFLPGSKINVEGSITASEVIQEEDTVVSVAKITSQKYIQNGGKIEVPRSGKATIDCLQFFANGGERAEPHLLTISDSDYLNRLGSTGKEQTILARTLGYASDETKEAMSETAVDSAQGRSLQELMDTIAKPVTEVTNSDNGVTLRGYNFSSVDLTTYTNFVTHALAAGWEVLREQPVGEIISVTIQKNNQK